MLGLAVPSGEKKSKTLVNIFNSRYKLDTRYSGAGEFFRLDPLSGRVTVRRALKELDSNQAAAPILLRIIAQEVGDHSREMRKKERCEGLAPSFMISSISTVLLSYEQCFHQQSAGRGGKFCGEPNKQV